MYTEVDGKLIETQIITIEPIGGAIKEQIISKINSMVNVNEEKIRELFEKMDVLKKMLKNGEEVTDEDVLSIAEEVDIEFGFESLGNKIHAIFELSDGSKHNTMVVLEALHRVISISKIQMLKNSVSQNKRMDRVNDDTFV
jgi:uncharacterized coiled-coil protein SlyX